MEQRTGVLWSLPERDLEHLAKWLSVIEGRAAPIERVARCTVDPSGRGGLVDDRHHELRRAFTVLDRLRALGAQEGGDRHVAVLRFAFLEGGPEWRRRVDPRLTGDGLAEAVGVRFAQLDTVRRWRSHAQRSLRRALPRHFGAQLLDAAARAYVALADEARNDNAAPDRPARGAA